MHLLLQCVSVCVRIILLIALFQLSTAAWTPRAKHCINCVNCPPGGSQLDKSLVGEINEYLLFHGTKQNMLQSISNHGLDSRLSANAMFGSGVYFAESSTKADQYAGDTHLLTFAISLMLIACSKVLHF